MNKTTKDYVGAVLIAIALFALIAFGLPYFNSTKELKTAIGERNKILVERGEILNNLKQLKDNFEKESATISKITAIIPEKKSLAEIISSISTIAPQSGLILNTVSVTEGQQTEQLSYNSLLIKLNMNGEYPSLASFLEQLEKSIRLTNTTAMNISSETQSNLLSFDITAETYFLK